MNPLVTMIWLIGLEKFQYNTISSSTIEILNVYVKKMLVIIFLWLNCMVMIE